MLKFAAFGLLLILLCPASSARSYYVDSREGNDSNNGATPASAWQTIAKVNGTHFAPGDTILLRRGSIWREQLTLSSPGSDSAPITIDAYGDGPLPIIDGADPVPPGSWSKCSSCAGGIWQSAVATKPNVVIVGSQKGNRKSSLDAIGSVDDWFWDSGTLYVDSSADPSKSDASAAVEAGARPSGINLTGDSDIVVRNVEVRGANAIPYGEGAGIWASTVHLAGPTPNRLLISHVTVTNGAGDGIHIENSDGSTVEASLVAFNDGSGIKIYGNNDKYRIASGVIRDNEVHHNRSNGINIFGCAPGDMCRSVVHPEGVVVTGLKITGNKAYDNGAGIYLHETNNSLVANNVAYSNNDTTSKGEGYCVGLSGSSSNIVEKNECYDARVSAIELSIDTGRPALGSSDNIIRYNDIHDDGTNGIFTNYIPSRNNKFLYNLIYNHPNGSCIMANYLGHEIFNNTCYNNRIGIHLYISSSTRETGDISVKNNIIAGCTERDVMIEPGVNGRLDFANNDYYPDSPQGFDLKGTISGFAGWRSGAHQDENSFVADPEFSVASPRKASDFVLRQGSPAVAKGANLGADFSAALAPSSLSWPDHVSVLPQNSAHWDIGALHHLP